MKAAQMKVAQVPRAGADFQIVERDIPSPGAGQVRIKVKACGICHSDVLVKDGLWPGIQYPRVPGHEVAGIIDEVSPGVSGWKKGQRAGVGWHGGHDGTCRECRRGDFRNCRNVKVSGISYDGGYQEYMVAPVEALVAIPDGLSDVEAAPLLDAGITTYNALRHSGALPGDLVAVQGIGGLGHLGVQFANKFGYYVAAIGRGPENAALAKKLGAHVYIECKRPLHERKIRRRVTEARKQLQNRFKTDAHHLVVGLVAISVSRTVNPGSDMFIVDEAEALQQLKDEVRRLHCQYSADYDQLADPRLLGIVYHLFTPAYVKKSQLFTSHHKLLSSLLH